MTAPALPTAKQVAAASATDLAALRAELEAVAEEMTNDLRPVTGACRMLDALVHRIRAVAANL